MLTCTIQMGEVAEGRFAADLLLQEVVLTALPNALRARLTTKRQRGFCWHQIATGRSLAECDAAVKAWLKKSLPNSICVLETL